MRPRFCRKCHRGDKGDGIFVRPFLWSHNSFLRETNENIKKYGEMEKLDACEKCIREIENRGHKVHRKEDEK